MSVLEDAFNILSGDASVQFVYIIWDANNLEVRLRLWQSWEGYFIVIVF